MQLIGKMNKIDYALLPIGDNFTMGPEDALEAVKMLKPNVVIPIHYITKIEGCQLFLMNFFDFFIKKTASKSKNHFEA